MRRILLFIGRVCFPGAAFSHPTTAWIQTIIDYLAKSRSSAKSLNLSDFIDSSILKELEDSGFVKRLYGN